MTEPEAAPARPVRAWRSIVIYTALRVLLFVAIWAVIQWLTPMKGVWAFVLAILISGAISFFVLNRQRNAMSIGVSRFFGGINARIDASARAEDPDPAQTAFAAGAGLAAAGAVAAAAGAAAGAASSEHGEAGADDQAVGEHEDSGALQGGDE